MCRLSVVLLLTGCSAHFVTFHGDTGDDTTGAETGGSADTATDSGTTDSGGSSSTDSDTGSVDPCAPRGTGAGLHIKIGRAHV